MDRLHLLLIYLYNSYFLYYIITMGFLHAQCLISIFSIDSKPISQMCLSAIKQPCCGYQTFSTFWLSPRDPWLYQLSNDHRMGHLSFLPNYDVLLAIFFLPCHIFFLPCYLMPISSIFIMPLSLMVCHQWKLFSSISPFVIDGNHLHVLSPFDINDKGSPRFAYAKLSFSLLLYCP